MNRHFRWVVAVTGMALIVPVASVTDRRAEAAESIDSPIAFAICTAEGAGAVEKCGIFGLPPAYQVPAGRRLIIEQVSGDCGDDGQAGEPLRPMITAQTQGVILHHAIIGVPNADSPGGMVPLTLTRIYADGGSSVTINLAAVPAFANRFCRVTFSGQLVK